MGKHYIDSDKKSYKYLAFKSTYNKILSSKKACKDKKSEEFKLLELFWRLSLISGHAPKSMKFLIPEKSKFK